MTTIHYGCTALVGTNKSGLLKPDADGRYDMVLGALEYPNSVGDIYTLKSAQQFFKEGSALKRKIDNGQLRAEYGHPKREPGMTDQEYLERILTIEETKVCAHISDVYIDTKNVKCPKTGRTIIAFRGKVKPQGPYGPYLKEELDDPKTNVAFSIRSLTLNKQVGFRQEKDFTQIVNWDKVTEPGLAPATKYSVPTLESRDVGETLDIDVELIRQWASHPSAIASNESAEAMKDLLANIESSKRRSLEW
nr:MAG TPA: Prohead core protein protease [Caudoviricetes sp.]